MRLPIAFVTLAIVFLAIDMVWLGVLARDLYRSQMGHLMADTVRFGAAAGFYLLYFAGVTYFVVSPAVAAGDWKAAILPGAFFGLVAYATYDLTNLAVIRDWPVNVTFIDLAWGAFLTSLAATVASFVALKVG